jgi:hypothetical protein
MQGMLFADANQTTGAQVSIREQHESLACALFLDFIILRAL